MALLFPVIFYFINFSKNPISNNSTAWANFGSYWSTFINLSNLIVFSFFTYIVYNYNLQRDKSNDILERPVIAFTRLATTNEYSLVNVGKGAALNIRIKSHLAVDKSHWQLEKIIYSCQNNFKLPLYWTANCNALSAQYEDIFGNKYVSFMDNDILLVIDLSDKQVVEKQNFTIRISNLKAEKIEWFS